MFDKSRKEYNNSILLGNGIHRLFNNEFEWGNSLKKIVKDDEKENVLVGSNTHAFEDIVLNKKYNNDIEQEIQKNSTEAYVAFKVAKKYFCQKLQEMCDVGKFSRDTMEYFSKLLELDVKNYMCTNYDDCLMSVCGCTEKKDSEYNNTSESTYSLKRRWEYEFGDKAKTLWRIHGQMNGRDSQSVILGYSQYCGYVRKIIDYMVHGRLGDCNVDEGYKWNSQYDYMIHKMSNDNRLISSWVDFFFFTNVHIIGFGMDFSELDLWEVLNRRKMYIEACCNKNENKYVNNEIHFYCSPKTDINLIAALKAYDVQVHKPEGEFDENDWTCWKSCMDENIKELKKNIEK